MIRGIIRDEEAGRPYWRFLKLADCPEFNDNPLTDAELRDLLVFLNETA